MQESFPIYGKWDLAEAEAELADSPGKPSPCYTVGEPVQKRPNRRASSHRATQFRKRRGNLETYKFTDVTESVKF